MLESLLLEGNPVTSEPNYRLRVIGLLAGSKLSMLDKVAVSAAEKEAGPLAFRRFRTFWDQAMKNRCDIVQYEHLVQVR